MSLAEWIDQHGRIAHTTDIYRAGFTKHHVHVLVEARDAERVRRHWISRLPADTPALIAARVGGQLTCVSLARERGWWIPVEIGPGEHLGLRHEGKCDDQRVERIHWSTDPRMRRRGCLRDTIEGALENIANCLSERDAVIIWESASRKENLPPDALRHIAWRTRRARAVAARVTGLADSGLDSILFQGLDSLNVRVRPQWVVGGRRKDALIGETLIIEVDGFEFHNSAARTRDVSHDAELALRGYTTLRFTYEQVVYRWPEVHRVIERAIARGLHRAR